MVTCLKSCYSTLSLIQIYFQLFLKPVYEATLGICLIFRYLMACLALSGFFWYVVSSILIMRQCSLFLVHPQNFRFQNVRFQNVSFQNVWFQNVWNVRFTKRQVYKMPGLHNVRSSKRPVAKNIHIYSVLLVFGNPQVLLQTYLQAKWWLCFILFFKGWFCHISP